MAKSINRLLAEIIDDDGDVQAQYLDNAEGGGLVYYDTLDSLPVGNLLSEGNLAFVQENQRMYISNGIGWYNAGLVNRTPRWDSGGEPDASYTISDSATPLVITAKAVDSDNSDINLFNQASASDSAQYMVSITNDSSVFTFTPKSADSIGIEVAAGNLSDSNGDFVYTFKWSDGISFVSKATTISYSPASGGISGGHRYTSPGTYTWTAPAGVTSVSVVTVGGGGSGGLYFGWGGGGGGLGWKNNIPVTPGSSYTVVVGAGGTALTGTAAGDTNTYNAGSVSASNGGNSYFISTSTVAGYGGMHGAGNSNQSSSSDRAFGGSYTGDGGGDGGDGWGPYNTSYGVNYLSSGGGGAGGYTGDGGNGAGSDGTFSGTYTDATNGSGGGGGGGSSRWVDTSSTSYSGAGGGGVGIYGQGTSGNKGTFNSTTAASSYLGGTRGEGGSGGSNGNDSNVTERGGAGGAYGGGGGSGHGSSANSVGGAGAGGAVRIIWGNGRSFPSTNVDLSSSLNGESTN